MNNMKKLIVIADLGRIRVVEHRAAGEDLIEQEHLVEDNQIEEPFTSRGEIVTDQSGRFGQHHPPGTPSGMSYGEQHNLNTELERKAERRLAARIAEILAEEGNPSWSLIAPQPILHSLEQMLPDTCRSSLSEAVGADLTKEPIAELEERFGIGRAEF